MELFRRGPTHPPSAWRAFADIVADHNSLATFDLDLQPRYQDAIKAAENLMSMPAAKSCLNDKPSFMKEAAGNQTGANFGLTGRRDFDFTTMSNTYTDNGRGLLVHKHLLIATAYMGPAGIMYSPFLYYYVDFNVATYLLWTPQASNGLNLPQQRLRGHMFWFGQSNVIHDSTNYATISQDQRRQVMVQRVPDPHFPDQSKTESAIVLKLDPSTTILEYRN